ncbi:MAG: hypothetical protein GDA50_01255 [Alphaproteobacteria bacterium GM202ARS2]|nr:hypothetical protein [Alphaproteobacteria bacterium GM202ARS2]
MTQHNIAYNSQRDNYDFDGQIPGNVQCFSTCMWMLLSAFAKSIKANDDNGLLDYVDDVESSVGDSGTAEDVMRQDQAIADAVASGIDSMFFWQIHQKAFRPFLIKHGVSNVDCVFSTQERTFAQLDDILASSPVVLGTRKLGGIKGGHVILLLGKHPEKNGYWVHDPFGDARTRYRNTNGAHVFYSKKRLLMHATDDGKTAKRCIYGVKLW